MVNLSGLYYDLGRYADALPMTEKALEIIQRDDGNNHILMGE